MKPGEAVFFLFTEDVEDPEKTSANQPGAFISQVGAQSGKKIDADDAEIMITWAEEIIGLIEQMS